MVTPRKPGARRGARKPDDLRAWPERYVLAYGLAFELLYGLSSYDALMVVSGFREGKTIIPADLEQALTEDGGYLRVTLLSAWPGGPSRTARGRYNTLRRLMDKPKTLDEMIWLVTMALAIKGALAAKDEHVLYFIRALATDAGEAGWAEEHLIPLAITRIHNS